MSKLVRAVVVVLVAVDPVAAAAGGEPGPPRSVTLSRGWVFQPDPNGVGERQHWERPEFDRGGWRPVTVPMAWDAYDPAMDGYEGIGWYALELPAGAAAPGTWQRLRFGRVNHSAKVWIDGHEAGEDSLGYLPFEIPVSPWLPGDRPTWIVVRVENGARYDWLPGTTTVEWVQYGGFLQPVELVTTPRTYIEHLLIRAKPRGSGGLIAADVAIDNVSASPFTGRVRLAAAGRTAGRTIRVEPGQTGHAVIDLPIPEARRWSPESPVLYEAHAYLDARSGTIDSVSDRFGVRSIDVRGRSILLNGVPLRIRGVNRYDEFPGCGPVADSAAVRADLEAVKDAGANLVRVHYPQAPMTLRIADEIGLLCMEEVPLNWWRAPWHPPVPPEYDNDRIVDTALEALDRMVGRDGNHPSVIVWSMANECETSDERGVRAMERLLRRARELDPTRLATYVANRKFEENRAFALADLVAVNLYFGMWDGDVAEGLDQIDSRVYDPTRRELEELTRRFGNKPLVLTEFGTIGIPGSGGDVRFSEDYQAAYLGAVWRAVEAVPEVSGGIVWCWADYRQRRGFTNDFPAYFGPFGIVTLDRRPKRAAAVLSALWKPAASAH